MSLPGEQSLSIEKDIPYSAKSAVEVYLATLSVSDKDTTQELADIIRNPNKPLASTQVIIPVAAHQEHPATVKNTLLQYACQTTRIPFSIILHLNQPFGHENNQNFKALIAAIQEVTESTGLDIRTIGWDYDDPTIGNIRRDAWNAALLVSWYDRTLDTGDVIGINHDIDTAFIHPRYIERVQAYYRRICEYNSTMFGNNVLLPPAFTMARHDIPKNTPNIAKIVRWSDFSLHHYRTRAGFEAGYIIPFSSYAKVGGFNAEHDFYETRAFSQQLGVRAIKGTHLRTSPRRYVERLQQGGSLVDIWEPGTFTAHNSYRTATVNQDISQERVEDIIVESLHNDIEHFFIAPLAEQCGSWSMLQTAQFNSTGDSPQSVNELLLQAHKYAHIMAEKTIIKIARFLRIVVQSDVLADLVLENYDPAVIAEQIYQVHMKDFIELFLLNDMSDLSSV